MNYKLRTANFNGGFSLLFALLIMSIVATISVSVSEIFLIELMMTGSVKESQSAFYAADTGAECVMYWDFIGFPDGFSTSTKHDIKCNNEDKTIGCEKDVDSGCDDGWTTDDFQLLFKDTADKPSACANIAITINPDKSRKIESFGRSRYIGDDCGASVPRRAERGLEVKYGP